MTTLLIVATVAALALLAARVVAAIHADGYGSTPPPRSHDDWDAQETPRGRLLF